MKKILYIEGCKDGTVGGSHTCLFTMVTNLDRRRFFPTVLFYDNHVIADKLRRIGIETQIFKKFNPINFDRLFKDSISLLKRASLILLPLQKIINFFFVFIHPALKYARYIKKQNIDIIHLNNGVISNHEWMLAAWISGVKVVSHERGINLRLTRTAKWFGKKMDMLICVSRAVAFPLLSQGLKENKLRIIYDGIDNKQIKLKRNPEELRKLYGIKDNSFVIGVVGNIKQWKGQEIVIRAVGILRREWPDIKCLLVGNTVENDPYRKKLDRFIRELEIGKNIIFTGFQDNPIDFFNTMDIVIHSSIEPEPFGMVNLEAMCLGKPVVASKSGGPLEIFADGEDGILVEPGNPVLLAQTISALIGNPELRRKMGQKAYETAIGRFRISDTLRQIEEAYEDVCRK